MLGKRPPTEPTEPTEPGRGFPDDENVIGTLQTSPPANWPEPSGAPGPMIPSETTRTPVPVVTMNPTGTAAMPDPVTLDNRTAGQKFLDEFERISKELETANGLNASLTTQLQQTKAEFASKQQSFDMQFSLQKDQIENLSRDKNRYLRYAVELAAQLNFMVAGSARALKIAQTVQASLAAETNGKDVPEVAGADLAELENIMSRLSANSPNGQIVAG